MFNIFKCLQISDSCIKSGVLIHLSCCFCFFIRYECYDHSAENHNKTSFYMLNINASVTGHFI